MYWNETGVVPHLQINNPGSETFHTGWENILVKDIPSRTKVRLSGGALKQHQRFTVGAAIQSNRRGMLIYHSTGTGKTTVAWSIVVNLLQNDPLLHAVIAAPSKSISAVWEPDRATMPAGLRDEEITEPGFFRVMTRVHLLTHDGMMKPPPLNRFVLLIDEAHEFRMSDLRKLNKSNLAATKLAGRAERVFLMTATPVFNDPFEAGTLYAMIVGQTDQDKILGFGKCFTKAIRDGDKHLITRMWKCLISYHHIDVTRNVPEFPLLVEHAPITRQMSSKEYEKFKLAQENGQRAFYSGAAQANNVPSKLLWVAELIKATLCTSASEKKMIVYSRFPKKSFPSLRKLLEDSNCPGENKIGEITGETSPIKTSETVLQFNRSVNGLLLLSAAGGSSLDLKGVRHVIIMEPHFNDPWIKQVVGRAVRRGSHGHLHPDERQVEVHHLIWDIPRWATVAGKTRSADRIIHNIAQRKKPLMEDFYAGLVDAAVENASSCAPRSHAIPKWVAPSAKKQSEPREKRQQNGTPPKYKPGDGRRADSTPKGYIADENDLDYLNYLDDIEDASRGTIEFEEGFPAVNVIDEHPRNNFPVQSRPIRPPGWHTSQPDTEPQLSVVRPDAHPVRTASRQSEQQGQRKRRGSQSAPERAAKISRDSRAEEMLEEVERWFGAGDFV
jgi:superfamily II DNA or RNA helicase